jgi:lipopolysaccharide exporter
MVRGALWTIVASEGPRAIGLVGTLVVTRFLNPAEYGEVMVAAVVVMTANQLSTMGFGHLLISRPESPRSVAFHDTVLHIGLGVMWRAPCSWPAAERRTLWARVLDAVCSRA